MSKRWLSSLMVAGTFLLSAFAPARADDPPGVLWEVTSQMDMQGMPMSPPPSTAKVCAARDSDQPPPPPPGQTCTMTNVQRSGSRLSWDAHCKGEMEMTGHGEITYDSPDSYRGEIRFSADGVTMTTRLSGRKIGTCDKPQ